ncbi:hypothetical protein QQS21_011064 [Conoideocrella luteorostrata]|uniref:Uncharacterized protein n=1 Tax=Conoideocrella luteorostrata TaxID=1105319 RepID=A0AAJ0CE17_9HYPO|nr:hypothetical protein QQS21_011064 [Conoideocrella luteorostrata]
MDDPPATTPSSPPPPPPPQKSQSRQFRRGHKYSASSPALIHAYANRSLPPLPPSASSPPLATMAPHFRRRRATTTSEGSSAMIERGGLSGTQSSVPRNDFPPCTLQHLGPMAAASSPKATPPQRSSCNLSARPVRRSSQKVYQLTGLDVDVMDHRSARSGSGASDSSSTRSDPRMEDFGAPDYHLVPVLEADSNGSSSRGSSWGPMSPESDAIPAPLNIHKPMTDGSEQAFDGLSESFPQLRLDDDSVRPWQPAYGQFSDIGAAGEYHRFTANLASRHSRQLSADSAISTVTPPKKKRSSLSLAFSAATRFSRRRDRPDVVDTSAPSSIPASTHKDSPKQQRQPSSADFVAGPAYSAPTTPRLPIDVAPPRPPPAPPLKSAWDSDTDEEETPAMSNLKDWFAHRSSEENKSQRRTSSAYRMSTDRPATWTKAGDQRESLNSRAQERAKQIKMEKAAKRREERKEEFRKNFAMIPEELVFSPPRFL